MPALSMQTSVPFYRACVRHIGLGDRPGIRRLKTSGSPLLRIRGVPGLPACQAAVTNTMHPAVLHFRVATHYRSTYHVFELVRGTSDPAIAPVPKACKRLAAIFFASLVSDVFLRARPCPHRPCAATHCMAKHIRKTFAQPAQCLTMPGSLCAAQKRGEPPGSPYPGLTLVHPGSSHSLLLRFSCALL